MYPWLVPSPGLKPHQPYRLVPSSGQEQYRVASTTLAKPALAGPQPRRLQWLIPSPGLEQLRLH